MSKTEIVDLISVACAGGAIIMALLVARLPSMDQGAVVKRVQAALLGCAMLLLLASVAVSFTTDSINAVASAFDSASARNIRDQEASAASIDGAARAFELRLKVQLAQFDEVVAGISGKLAELRSEKGELAEEVIRIKQVVAEQEGFARLESLEIGTYYVGFESSYFTPAAAPKDSDERWWIEFSEFGRGKEMLKGRENKTLLVCVKGVRSAPGRFGHMGGSRYLFLVSEVLAVGTKAVSACPQRTLRRSISLPKPPA